MLWKMKTTLKLIEDFCIQTDKKTVEHNHPGIVVLVDNKVPTNEERLTQDCLDKNGIMQYS